MAKPRSEEDKKHGDKLESLIGRTGGASPRDERDDDGDADPMQPRDDDDEDVQNGDVSDRRDVG